MKECERLNEDLALMNEPNNFADEFDNDVTSSSNEAPINFDNISLSSSMSETAAKSCTSEHEQQTCVLRLQTFFLITNRYLRLFSFKL